MPGRDGTGPQGTGTGGYGGQRGRRTGGGRTGDYAGAGPGGSCICPQCGTKKPHQAGLPCFKVNCPQCGTAMVRA